RHGREERKCQPREDLQCPGSANYPVWFEASLLGVFNAKTQRRKGAKVSLRPCVFALSSWFEGSEFMPQLPPLTQQDCAYFDYVEGLKVYNYTRHVKQLLEKYEEKAARFKEKNGYPPSTMNEA